MGDLVSFVCCVESGWLEAQTVRLVESLRRHGGRYAAAPVLAVTPRFGPPLARATRDAFDRHGVRHLRPSAQGSRYGWFKFINKPLALVAAEEAASTEVVCWLDSDLLVLAEPDVVALEGVDFVACASDKEMGTSGPGDPYEPLWAELARAADLSLDDLPWITTELDQKRIRLYWNSGFFAYRHSTGFAGRYLEMCERLLDARCVTGAPGYSTGINEMSALGLAMLRAGLRYRALSWAYNYPLASVTPAEWYSPERLRATRILHHHDCMVPALWPTFIERLRATHPEVAAWLAPLGPMRNEAHLGYRALGKGLRTLRDRQETAYRAACRAV